MKKKVLELFAGSRSIGKQAEDLGMEVLSVDKFIAENMDLVCGVEEITKEIIIEKLGIPDIIWASPVCSAWSKTGWFHYWNTQIYKLTNSFVASKPFANESVEMVRKTIEIFSWFPEAYFFMENPEGMLQKHPVLSYFKVCGLRVRKTNVTYCRYGDTIRKPTQIWNNCTNWIPKMPCNNGDKCHEYSPRGSQRGILGKESSYERSKIPDALCKEILLAADGINNYLKTDYEQQMLFSTMLNKSISQG